MLNTVYIILGIALILGHNYMAERWAEILEEHQFPWPARLMRWTALITGIAFVVMGVWPSLVPH